MYTVYFIDMYIFLLSIARLIIRQWVVINHIFNGIDRWSLSKAIVAPCLPKALFCVPHNKQYSYLKADDFQRTGGGG